MQKLTAYSLVLLTFFAAALVFSLGGWLAYEQGWLQWAKPQNAAMAAASAPQLSDDAIELICECTYTLPVNGFDSEPKTYTDVLLAGLDFGNKTGWYQGQMAISQTRKGALVMDGTKAVVSRPAMFQRYGEMVTGEQFTIDRATGEFTESVDLKDGRKFSVLKGICGKFIKAQF